MIVCGDCVLEHGSLGGVAHQSFRECLVHSMKILSWIYFLRVERMHGEVASVQSPIKPLLFSFSTPEMENEAL